MKNLVLLALHGSGGAGTDGTYSPTYPWSASDSLQDFMNRSMKLDPRFRSSLFRGVFWKPVLEAGLYAQQSGKFDSVTVICSRGDIGVKNGRWFGITELRSVMRSPGTTTLIPVGKSMGGFDTIAVAEQGILDSQTRRFPASLRIPFALLIDPDSSPLPARHSARIIPREIETVVTVRQENLHAKNSFLPQGLCGRKVARKNGSEVGIKDYVYMTPTLFPAADREFCGREVNHWTIDEHMATIGHPECGTIGSLLCSAIDREVERIDALV